MTEGRERRVRVRHHGDGRTEVVTATRAAALITSGQAAPWGAWRPEDAAAVLEAAADAVRRNVDRLRSVGAIVDAETDAPDTRGFGIGGRRR